MPGHLGEVHEVPGLSKLVPGHLRVNIRYPGGYPHPTDVRGFLFKRNLRTARGERPGTVPGTINIVVLRSTVL